MNSPRDQHKSVMVNELAGFLEPADGETVIDCTLGLGGHSEPPLQTYPGADVVGIAQDAAAVAIATERLKKFGDRFRGVHANFSEIKQIVSDTGVGDLTGIIADLGVSSMQLDDPERGFSFRFDAPLDMRMDPSSGDPTAAELLETLDEEEIANLIYRYGEERKSRRIARFIVE